MAHFDSAMDTLAHIERLAAKRDMLTRAQADAESVFLASVQRSWSAGELSMLALALLYGDYRSLADPGFSKRWDEAVEVTAAELVAYKRRIDTEPPEPEHGWIGSYPLDGVFTPRKGVCVVYVLFDANNDPCYVGSTNQLRIRLKAHARDGKRFSKWQARSCPDRDAAYALEREWLARYMPYLNRKAC